MQYGSGAARPHRAFRMGAAHGLWFMMPRTTSTAMMAQQQPRQLVWMAVLTALIFAEKNASGGERIATAGAVAFAIAGVALLARPAVLTSIT